MPRNVTAAGKDSKGARSSPLLIIVSFLGNEIMVARGGGVGWFNGIAIAVTPKRTPGSHRFIIQRCNCSLNAKENARFLSVHSKRPNILYVWHYRRMLLYSQTCQKAKAFFRSPQIEIVNR